MTDTPDIVERLDDTTDRDAKSDAQEEIKNLRAEVERLERHAQEENRSHDNTVFILRAERDAAIARAEKLEAALTPSLETKAALMGEFSMQFPGLDENGEEYMRTINVPWTTIKEIMAAIRALASLTEGETE